ncbi:hypothetical protein CANARDRAFT_203209 [[Candida] arabinofermentans NRRL YB-2248]|uniref:Endoplasmic reticulum oxidoreductin 1 n=1 Tax=[Candida] arabinofermentans NRRL YB-2248 TaxID=983967 RepID=A0A1E4SV93_9ASCO|nr:hypothetical protein CANARDRAFT_203209 [[Candida] arabinofermentans NRRL YB-2248]
MKITQLITLWVYVITSVLGSGLVQVSSLDKKPINLPQQYHYQSIHEFQSTPFNNYEEFINSVIKESSNVRFQQINDLNREIRPVLDLLINENFFKIFRLNLYKECPFWSSSEGFCMHQSCAVDTIDDWKDLPEIWQPEALGKIESLSKEIPSPTDVGGSCVAVTSSKSKDYCELDEANEDSVYVNLVDNPERFTGYGGDQSFQIWKSIYNENCFNLGSDQCIEKDFFYTLISGMHSSISTHLTNEYLNLKTKTYGPDLKQFMIRVGDFPERFESLYLNYIIVVKSLIKLQESGLLTKLNLCEDTSFATKEAELKDDLRELISPFYQLADDNGDHELLFNEKVLFQDEGSSLIKDEFRENFRNISRIMDCVHCDRCRLWGKVQTTGYGTALKILFELENSADSDIPDFEITKIELVALINTFDRLSKTVAAIENFKKLYDQAMEEEETGVDIATDADHYDQFLMGHTLTNTINEVHEEAQPQTPEETSPTHSKETFSENFYQELGAVKEALMLVLGSYRIFPKIIYNWCLIRIIYYWNTFVGHVHEDFDMGRLYELEL